MAGSDSSPIIISRKEAITQGLSQYFTGVPCKRGHISKRQLPAGNCIQCSALWWDENEHRKQGYEKKRRTPLRKKKQSDWNAERYQRNREAIRLKAKDHYIKNRDYAKQRQSTYTREKRAELPEVFRSYHLKRVALKTGNGGSHSPSDINDIFKLQVGKCAICRVQLGKSYHVDHIVALSNGGRNDRCNLQLLCRQCNLEKSNRDPIDHMQSLGFLL